MQYQLIMQVKTTDSKMHIKDTSVELLEKLQIKSYRDMHHIPTHQVNNPESAAHDLSIPPTGRCNQ